ncbi:hypothetical protein, probably exported protein (plasmid) [Cupriavidus metallidurans CH34]|uniref:Uncharacterized protein n=1 Tax=Cupriavidus metallidurans (strain ATCC 43123 / DSM 2839 / NBRC 102507 / CH34) TaxID=266264 RepID=Q1LFF2_CUPMC|nr:hypothetical protein, probably exported protein [Cupriavidus metallidurans CH34]
MSYCDRPSLAASSLFAFFSIGSLLVYAVFGVLYLGAAFAPPIHDHLDGHLLLNRLNVDGRVW